MKSLNTLRHYGCRTLTALVALVCLAFSHSLWADNLYFVHTDHLGTPVVITDGTQATVWQGDKTPFGETTATVNQIEFNVRFPGQYYDQESGLHYNYYRDYDPTTGRYVQSDPIGLRGGLNTYAYATGNPLTFFDPKGTDARVIGGGLLILGTGLLITCLDPSSPTCQAARDLGQRCLDEVSDAWSSWNESAESENGSDDDWEKEYEDFLNSGEGGYTDHGQDSADDPSRDVGNPADVVSNGERFRDTETGATVYVDGSNVVIVGDSGTVVTQWNDQTASETSGKVGSGVWDPY